jgi:hypothetical protein
VECENPKATGTTDIRNGCAKKGLFFPFWFFFWKNARCSNAVGKQNGENNQEAHLLEASCTRFLSGEKMEIGVTVFLLVVCCFLDLEEELNNQKLKTKKPEKIEFPTDTNKDKSGLCFLSGRGRWRRMQTGNREHVRTTLEAESVEDDNNGRKHKPKGMKKKYQAGERSQVTIHWHR